MEKDMKEIHKKEKVGFNNKTLYDNIIYKISYNPIGDFKPNKYFIWITKFSTPYNYFGGLDSLRSKKIIINGKNNVIKKFNNINKDNIKTIYDKLT